MLPALRFVRWTVLGSVLVAIVVSVVLAGGSPSSPQSLSAMFGGSMRDTPWGPLGPADRDMLIKVRQADLWAGAMGEQASTRARSTVVRDAARKLATEHAQLDADLRATAAKLNVTLPDEPSDMERVWMGMITKASPADYDKTFVNLVRSAHGNVLPLVQGVRAGTQNQQVRQLAIEASDCLARTMDALEATGLVDYALFPSSTAPAARVSAMGGYTVPVTLVLFVLAVLVGAALLRGVTKGRPGAGAASRRDRFAWVARIRSRLGLFRLVAENLTGGRRGDRSEDRKVSTAELLAVLCADETAGERPAEATRRLAAARSAQPGVRPTAQPGAQHAATRPVGSVSARSIGAPNASVTNVIRPTPARAGRSRTAASTSASLTTSRPADRPEQTVGNIPTQRAVRSPKSSRSGRRGDGGSVERKPPKLGRASGARPW